MAELNGFHKDLQEIKNDVNEIKDHLASSVLQLADAVNNLSARFDLFMRIAENAIPIKAVFLMFLILILALIGVEGADWLFKTYLKGATL